jgi:hypothetical protein
MFLSLLLITFLISALTAHIVVKFFDKPIEKILTRIISDDISNSWHRYIKFAVYVVGISGGVRIWSLEQYIAPVPKDGTPLVLDLNRWVLEIYRTILGTLQSIAWMLLVFFIFALIAFVLVKIFEMKKSEITSPILCKKES